MKKLTALLLVMVLLLSGCGTAAPEATAGAPATEAAPVVTEATTEAATEPTTIPTTEPIIYTNPLNGQVIDAPFTNRIFASTISNVPAALPHVGVNQADIIMEMYVNGSNVRNLALYSDISKVPMIGSVRSLRLMFTDLADHYDLIISDANGSPTVLEDAENRGTNRINLGDGGTYYSVRDKDRWNKLGKEHSLMGYGENYIQRAQELGYATTRPEGADYGFRFTENGTPVNGEDAALVKINLVYRWKKGSPSDKETIMKYDPALGKYVYNQYNKEMVDAADGQKEAFTNVLVVYADIDTLYGSGTSYQYADFLAGGTGYYANGGKIVPITWTCDGDQEPLRFFNEDGSELLMGVGNTYMAICPEYSPVTWTASAE